MSNRFIKFIPSEEAMFLVKKHPKAFILLTFIAQRARREPGLSDGLSVGQCHIGDHENMGLTRQEYRTALKTLIDKRFLEKLETCRTRQKSTTNLTTVGTLVKLCDSRIYDINLNDGNHRINHRPTTGQPPANHDQEGRRMNKKEKEEEEDYARTAPRPRIIDSISFDFSTFAFLGITDQDKADWRVLYPHIDLEVEMLKMVTWLKANPSKSRKKQWLKFITNWLARGNDNAENKKAYRESSKVKENQSTNAPQAKFHARRVLKAGNDV